jgi:hypothetical protein
MDMMQTLQYKSNDMLPTRISSRLDDSLFSKDLAPHYMDLAKKLATSELVPKGFRGKPQDLFIAWAMGYQIGLAPEQAMQCIAIINGKPAMWGDDMLALCMAHKDFEDIIEEPLLRDSDIIGYTCMVKRRGMQPKINSFTLDMAKKAGLLAKGGVWTQYPERMLKLRARGFTLRDAFPDALKGIKPREEVEDYIDIPHRVVDQEGSRTEQLKNDLINRQGVTNVDEVCGLATSDEHKVTHETDTPDASGEEENDVGDQTSRLHSEIELLIAQKAFTEPRLSKALAYYEVNSIEEMTIEAAENFIKQLLKL